MKFISNRYVVKIPSEIRVIYCESRRLLILKTDKNKKLIKLNLKILFVREKNVIIVTDYYFSRSSNKDKKILKSLQGLTVSLIKKSLFEVSTITCKKLKLVGVGYKVFFSEPSNLLNLKLGYSHSIYYKIPTKITVKVIQSTKIFVFGYNYKQVCYIASILRRFKVPEPYKGKGIKYFNEIIKLKEGKKI